MRPDRLAFVLADLEREVRNIAPQVSGIDVVLPAGAFRPVVEALANHFGSSIAGSESGSVAVGIVNVRRAD